MGFGKLLKDIAGGIKEINDERRERKQQEELRGLQRGKNIDEGKFCKICIRIGEFENRCNDCSQFPICNDCCKKNEKWGAMCKYCAPKYMCFVGCGNLSSDECVSCNKKVCQEKHWRPFFVGKGQVFECGQDKGHICIHCVDKGKTGTFRKRYNCPKCGHELQVKTMN